MQLSRDLILSAAVWLNAVAALDSQIEHLERHSNHVFNAVHSSMRQWGSSLNHNGMSFFLAKVPESTYLYHGTHSKDRMDGMQWLAFELEHAMLFARGPRGPPGHNPPYGPPPGFGDPESPIHSHQRLLQPEQYQTDAQQPLARGGGKPISPTRESHHGSEPPRWYQSTNGRHKSHEHTPLPYGFALNNEGSDQYGSHLQPPRPSEGKAMVPDRKHPPPPPNLHDDHDHDGQRHGRPYPPPSGDFERGHPRMPDHCLRPPAEESRHVLPPHNSRQGEQQEERRPQPAPSSYSWFSSLFRSHEAPSDSKPRRKSTAAPDNNYGYLHTYSAKHDLRLLYVDGMSAGKTTNGTLDSQDYILLNNSMPCEGMRCENIRAETMCQLASTEWGGHIDGILRMEGGFEIIMCSFSTHLDLVNIVQTSNDVPGGFRGMAGFQYYKAVADRYHGIGGNRVIVDYDNFITAYSYPADLFSLPSNSDTALPRLLSVSNSTIQLIRDDLRTLILNKDWSPAQPTYDWQSIADMLVQRYSAPLHFLTSTTATSSPSLFFQKLDQLLRPFIDFSHRSATHETQRCVNQLVPSPSSSRSNLSQRSISSVAHRICSTLVHAHSFTSSLPSSSYAIRAPTYSQAVQMLQELKDWLQWSSWKECGPCADDEVCVIPIWPMGTFEDHAQPTCQNETGMSGRRGYWGDFGPGRPGGPGGEPGEKPPR